MKNRETNYYNHLITIKSSLRNNADTRDSRIMHVIVMMMMPFVSCRYIQNDELTQSQENIMIKNILRKHSVSIKSSHTDFVIISKF
jgi:hypothetical protein